MKTDSLVIIGVVVLGLLFVLFRPSIDLLPEAATTQQALVPSSADAATLNGVDVSHYQGDISWSSVSEDGIAFAYLKATEGESLADTQYASHVKKLNNTDITFGSYHFFQPSDDVDTQVNFFLSKVNLSGQLAPVLDIEVSHGESSESIKSSVLAWLKAVESKTGCKPIIYTYKDFWETNLGSDFSDYRLWLADYADQPALPSGVSSYVFWQHSQKGKVNGINGSVDLNVFSGTADDLKSLLCEP